MLLKLLVINLENNMDSFAIFITTHGRSNNCTTLNTLKSLGCKYPIYLIVDDLDKDLDSYKVKFGDCVKVFSKQKYVNLTDTIMTPKVFSAVVFARNFCEDLAKMMGLKYFLILDDDIKNFKIRFPINTKLTSTKINNIDKILDIYLDYLDNSPLGLLGFGNKPSYIGGLSNFYKTKRRCFNAFLRKTSIPFTWVSNFNEDTISCVVEGKRGFLVLELPYVQLEAIETGKGTQNGGMFEMYNNIDEYKRKFNYVIIQPNIYSIYINSDKEIKVRRIWDNAIPKIIKQKYRK